MEEILASIRRIISDDEANSSAQQTAKTAEYPGQIRPEDADYEAADTQIIDDIARVLSGGAAATSVPTGGAPAANDDDILDLADLGGAPSEAAGEPIDVEMLEVAELTVTEDMVVETEIYTEPRKAPSFAAAFPPSHQETPTRRRPTRRRPTRRRPTRTRPTRTAPRPLRRLPRRL